MDAVPTTDIVSCPHLHLHADQPLLLVSFGRSGNSPESLQAVTLAESLVKDVRHLLVTCNAEGALGNRAQVRQAKTLLLPEETHDVSFAMTSSFSCMMYATLNALSKPGAFDHRIGAIAQATRRVIQETQGTCRNWRATTTNAWCISAAARSRASRAKPRSSSASSPTAPSPPVSTRRWASATARRPSSTNARWSWSTSPTIR